ncbi:MAG: hypothetical protein ABR601_05185 [Parasphingopyxis sp.]|nr:hypothetical protein [Sphingomonadales bacterium]
MKELVENHIKASGIRVINFEEAEVRPGTVGGTHFLIVSGEAPCANMDVSLIPLIYIECPDYWGIEVVGSLPGGVCLTSIKPFILVIPLEGVIGREGIEVIGANKSKKFEVSGGCE